MILEPYPEALPGPEGTRGLLTGDGVPTEHRQRQADEGHTDHRLEVPHNQGQTGGEEQRQVSEQMAVIRNDMRKIWKQNVFYDIGEVVAENTPVAWMDFKAYCLDGNLYSLLFMFQTQARSILGNFHCSFPIYDIWKPVVLKLLTTIQAENTSI